MDVLQVTRCHFPAEFQALFIIIQNHSACHDRDPEDLDHRVRKSSCTECIIDCHYCWSWTSYQLLMQFKLPSIEIRFTPRPLQQILGAPFAMSLIFSKSQRY